MFINYSVLAKSELFSSIPVMDIPKAVQCLQGKVKMFSKDELIFKSNGTDNQPGIILEGKLTVTQLFSDGSNVLIRNIGATELFGVFLACGGDDSTYVTAAEDSIILFLKLPVTSDINPCNCKYRLIVMENLIRILIKNNKYLNQKIKIISRQTIREKLMQFFHSQIQLQNSRTIKLDMNREKLAEFICSDRSAVSRELSRMKKEGIIEINKNVIKILI